MKHFVDDDGLNAFRLPVAWQYLVNNNVGGTLDSTNFPKYDALVQACLVTGAFCIIDIHNYARWNGEIIGQGGPSDSDFASLWSQLATKYAQEDKVVMGLMNEPHDSELFQYLCNSSTNPFQVPDMTTWATSVQAAVTAIRKAGATSQHILLPGTGYTSAESFVSSGSAEALGKVTNIDGSTDNLIFDVHKYLDSDNSGTHAGCVENGISNAFQPLASYLTQNKRIALLSETGGGSDDPSCLTDVCAVTDFLNQNSDVYLGILGWAAGAFDPKSYVLSLTPTQSGSTWTDQPLLKQCFAAKFSGGNSTSPSPPSSPSGGSSAPLPPTGSSTPVNTGSPITSTSSIPSYTPPSFPSSSGGAAPISYGGSMSWSGSNSTSALATGTGMAGVTGTYSAPYYQSTTFATSVSSSSAEAPASSSSPDNLTGPGNNDGASVWGSKSGLHQMGHGPVVNGGEDDGDEDCDVEYV